MKIICVNCEAKNCMKVDHRSSRRNFWSCEKKARKKFRLVRDSNPRRLRYRCSAVTNWTNKPTGSRSLNWLRPYRWKRGRIVDRAHSLAFSSVPLRESRSILTNRHWAALQLVLQWRRWIISSSALAHHEAFSGLLDVHSPSSLYVAGKMPTYSSP